jgi:hypothetical protein
VASEGGFNLRHHVGACAMTRPCLAAIGLLLGGVALVAGCGRTGPPAPAGTPPTVIGPGAVLLRTPDSFGHASSEMSVAFSPDGGTLAVGVGSREAVVLWDTSPARSLAAR